MTRTRALFGAVTALAVVAAALLGGGPAWP